MMVFKKKKFFVIILFLITGCTSYTQLSSDVRIVKHKLFNDKENIYLEKFDKKTNIWLKAKCNDSIVIENCANNTEFVGVSKMKIENLLSKNKDNNTNNQNSNSNDPGETSKENEDDNSEDDEEDDEEEEEDEEEEWNENDPGE